LSSQAFLIFPIGGSIAVNSFYTNRNFNLKRTQDAKASGCLVDSSFSNMKIVRHPATPKDVELRDPKTHLNTCSLSFFCSQIQSLMGITAALK
jgi:hypothetical protein